MAIKQVIASKRCLMIRPYELSNLRIGLCKYSPTTQYEFEGSFEPEYYAADKESFFNYGALGSSNSINQNMALALMNYTKIGETADSHIPIYRQNNAIIVRNKILFHYDDNKYIARLIESKVSYGNTYTLDTYFQNKKLFKIIDIYVDTFDLSKREANIIIYYLEKK